MLELFCIALVVYYEARGEPWAGQLAVASVVVNRVHDPRWPDNACLVMKEKGQFEFWPPSYPISNPRAWNRALAAASYAQEPTIDALFFAQPGYHKGPFLAIANHEFRVALDGAGL